jgi:hypothetical protein
MLSAFQIYLKVLLSSKITGSYCAMCMPIGQLNNIITVLTNYYKFNKNINESKSKRRKIINII